jgi:hypothetical protein
MDINKVKKIPSENYLKFWNFKLTQTGKLWADYKYVGPKHGKLVIWKSITWQ